MNFLFAWRYFKAKKSTNAINIISWVSVLAILLITAAFIVLLSVFNGFEGLVKSLYSSFYADIRISAARGKIITVTPGQLQALGQAKYIYAYSLEVEEKALVQNADVQAIVYLKGVDSNYAFISGVPKKIIRGSFTLGNADTPALVMGGGVEYALAADVEKSIYPLTVYLFRPGVNVSVIDPYQAFSAYPIIPAGTFFIQQDIDSKYALTNIRFMKRMLGLAPDAYSSIEIALTNPEHSEEGKKELQNIFGTSYRVETRFEQNRSLYTVMRTEKWAIFGILTLMLVVAAFTMVGALTMLVLEKRKDIQVLKSMGADNGLIQKIFLSEGLLLAAIGTAGGMLLGILVCLGQITFKWVAIQGGSFLIDYYPVQMKPLDFLMVISAVFTVGVLASWFPSRKAAREPISLRT